MSTVGQIEKQTQARVVKLFHDTLGYDYLGSWIDRPNNRHVEETYLRAFLQQQGYSATLIDRAIFELDKVAGDQARSLYDINKAVYGLLRYGVKVREEVGEHHQTVWLIDWEHPEA